MGVDGELTPRGAGVVERANAVPLSPFVLPTAMAPVTTREKASWAMFDVANSPFATLMITVFFGKFFQEHVVPRSLAHRSHTLWAATISTAMALVALA